MVMGLQLNLQGTKLALGRSKRFAAYGRYAISTATPITLSRSKEEGRVLDALIPCQLAYYHFLSLAHLLPI